MDDGSITRLQDHHHRAAVLLSTGKTSTEVAEITGMSVSRVATLKADPDFQRLVSAVKGKINQEFDPFLAVTKKRELAEFQVWEEIVRRLETHPEKFTVKELLEVQADAADRLGRSKVLRSERLTMNMDLADSLAEARRRELRLTPAKGEKGALAQPRGSPTT